MYTEKELLYATQIAYYDFTPEVIAQLKEENNGETPTLQETLKADTAIKAHLEAERQNAFDTYGPDSLQVQRAQTAINRYEEMLAGTMCNGWKIVDIRDENDVTGMVACLIETDDDSALIAFRGSESDETSQIMLDWIISDVGLLNAYETVQQQSVENYTEYISNKYGAKYSNFATSGHSLGGNLAFHAALTAPKELRDKISQAYSMDGPGYSDEYIMTHHEDITSMTSGVMQHRGWSLVGSLLNNLNCAEYQWVQVDSVVSGPGFQKHDTCFPIVDDNGNFVTGGQPDLLAAIAGGISKGLEPVLFNSLSIPFAVLEKYLESHARQAAEKKREDALEDHDFENEQQIVAYLMEHTGNQHPEYLVRGALLRCRCGTHARRLNLSRDHGVYVASHPLIHELNCKSEARENITFFGVCKSPAPPPTEIESYIKDVQRGPGGAPTGEAPGGFEIGHKCEPLIVDGSWKDTYTKTRIVDNGDIDSADRAKVGSGRADPSGLASVTTLSFLVCNWGGLIEPCTSGQEIGEAELPAAETDCDDCSQSEELHAHDDRSKGGLSSKPKYSIY